jgi:hypothetical protein
VLVLAAAREWVGSVVVRWCALVAASLLAVSHNFLTG